MNEHVLFTVVGGEIHAKTRRIKTTKFKLINTIQPYTTDYSLWNLPHDVYLWAHMVGPLLLLPLARVCLHRATGLAPRELCTTLTLQEAYAVTTD